MFFHTVTDIALSPLVPFNTPASRIFMICPAASGSSCGLLTLEDALLSHHPALWFLTLCHVLAGSGGSGPAQLEPPPPRRTHMVQRSPRSVPHLRFPSDLLRFPSDPSCPTAKPLFGLGVSLCSSHIRLKRVQLKPGHPLHPLTSDDGYGIFRQHDFISFKSIVEAARVSFHNRTEQVASGRVVPRELVRSTPA